MRGSLRTIGIALGVHALALAFSVSAADAASGSLDPTFSGDGWTRTSEVIADDEGYLPGYARDIEIQADGKILAVSELIDSTGGWYFGVFRYLANGELDLDFGKNGLAETDFDDSGFPEAVAVQPSGKIIVGGTAPYRGDGAMCFTLVRYTSTGEIDPTFGESGVAQAPSLFKLQEIAVAPSGKVLAVGIGGGVPLHGSFVVAAARFRPDGELDTSFSKDGKFKISLGDGTDEAHAVAIQEDGRILLVRRGSPGSGVTNDDFAVVRLRKDGTRDPSFSGDGVKVVDFGGFHDVADGVDIQPDGRIVLAGISTPGWNSIPDPRLALARLLPDGRLDSAFGGNGKVRKRLSHGAYALDLRVQQDGKIVAVGTAFADGLHSLAHWAVIRFRPHGSLDRGFGDDGLVLTRQESFRTGGVQGGATVALQDDGRIVVGGGLLTHHASQILARFLPS
jgi:uncharacterized delta-60 repeat protein